MDVAALSSLNQSNFSQAVGVSILKMADNQSVQQSQALVQMMEQSVQPNLGSNIDIKV
jgi:hypothetical protein